MDAAPARPDHPGGQRTGTVRGHRAGTIRDYVARHPCADDVGVVIEVADSTLLPDRRWKRKLYARNGIPEFWLVNLQRRTLEVYRHPTADGDYADFKEHTSEEIVPLMIDGITCGEFAVRDILP
ncbi:MAG: Uma2 family endonuclease [Planctomycetaceae bacterium]